MSKHEKVETLEDSLRLLIHRLEQDRHLLYDAIMPVIRDLLAHGKTGTLTISTAHRDHETVLGYSSGFQRSGRVGAKWALYKGSDGLTWKDGKTVATPKVADVPKPQGGPDLAAAYDALLEGLTDPDRPVTGTRAVNLIDDYRTALWRRWRENDRP